MANAQRRNSQWSHCGLYRLEGFELFLPRRQTTFAVSQKTSHDGGVVNRMFGLKNRSSRKYQLGQSKKQGLKLKVKNIQENIS
jgi:hypothetical protein